MTTPAATLNASYPAVAAAVPEARDAVAELAAAAGAPAEQVERVRLAASEAITNAVVHAYRGGHGQVSVTAAVVSDELWVLIGDDGCGMQVRSDSPGLGLGLLLISQETDYFTVLTSASGGTEVRMRFDLAELMPRLEDGQERGSVAAARRPASSRFSTTT